MKNTAFKTFVYSFTFSLFAIFGINGAFFAEKNSNTSDLTISNRNITLFLKNDAVAAKPLPVKKIALSILPDIQHSSLSKTPDYYDIPAENEQIIMADNSDLIPLEFEENSAADESEVIEEENLPVILAANQQHEPEVPALYAPVQAQVVSVTDGPEPTKEPVIAVSETKPVNSKIQDNVSEPIKLAAVYSPTEQPETSAHKPAEAPAASLSEKSPALLIPLERSRNFDFIDNKKVVIGDSSKEDRNQVALADANISTKNIPAIKKINDTDISETTTPKTEAKWESMAEKAEKSGKTDNPWVVATGTRFAKNKIAKIEPQKQKKESEPQKEIAQSLEAEQVAGGSETVAANDMIDNLLIPIPKEIKEKENLTPRLQFPEDEERKEDDEEIRILDAQGKNIAKNKEKEESRGGNLLSSITSIFSSAGDNKNSESDEVGSSETIVNKIKNKLTAKNKESQILPAEIRLSFQPNRAEISGNTLRWIDAFAQKTIEDKSVVLEIRLDGTTDQYLQRRRLNLLSNILNNKGVSARDVKVVFTEREPNSFIIRTLRTNKDSDYEAAANYHQTGANVTQW